MGPLDFTVVSLLLSYVAVLKSTWQMKCCHLLQTPDTTLTLHPVLSVVFASVCAISAKFHKIIEDCRPKIKVGLNYITKFYLLFMD